MALQIAPNLTMTFKRWNSYEIPLNLE